jgi:hypothetical protein
MRRPALTDRQIARMAWRIQRFQRFGLPKQSDRVQAALWRVAHGIKAEAKAGA